MACFTIPRVGPTNRLDHRVIVIGGGIGGLTAAIALLNRGIDVDVDEQAPKLAKWAPATHHGAWNRRTHSAVSMPSGSGRFYTVCAPC
jgi:succinate dehydrogenase/fumarate reductase flavoprotein subunit